MKRLFALLLLPCLVAATMAAEVVQITPGQTVVLQTSAGPAKAVVLPAPDGNSFFVLSIGTAGGNLAVPFTVMPYGSIPIPGPGPSPSPAPAPNPVAGKLWILSVTETKDQTPEQAAVLHSKAVAELIAARGWQWRKVDKDVVDQSGQVPSDLAAWIDRAKVWVAKPGNKWPYLNLADSQGMTVWEGALPATEQELVELLKRWGGP